MFSGHSDQPRNLSFSFLFYLHKWTLDDDIISLNMQPRFKIHKMQLAL